MAKKKEVLLVQDVLKVGSMGDLVRVAPGYARNYLFPYNMAVPAQGAAKRQIEVLREKAAKAESEREAKAQAQKKTMLGLKLALKARVAHDDVLFGSIGAKEIVAALAPLGYVVDPKMVHLSDKLRKLGVYTVEVRLHKNVPVEISVEISNSDPNAPTLAQTLAAAEAAKAAKAAKAEAAAEGETEAKGSDEKPAKAKGDKPVKAKDDKGAKADKGGKDDKSAAKAGKSDKNDKNDKKKKG